jgi:SAM-dependent methyltransferase
MKITTGRKGDGKMNKPKAIELGCGTRPYSCEEYEWYYVDYVERPLQNLTIHNLNYYPYPLPSNEYELVVCNNVFEHLVLYDKDKELWCCFFEEVSRILKPSGKLFMRVPHFTNGFSLEHHGYFTVGTFVQSFKERNEWMETFFKSDLRIKKIKVELQKLWKWASPLINYNAKTLEVWEKYLCFIIRATDITMEFEKEKN